MPITYIITSRILDEKNLKHNVLSFIYISISSVEGGVYERKQSLNFSNKVFVSRKKKNNNNNK